MSGGPRWEPIEPPTPPTTPQPMRLGQVLEIGVRILRRLWPVMLGLALLFAGPGALLTAATGLRFTDVAVEVLGLEDGEVDTSTALTQVELDRLLEAIVPYLAATLVAGLLLSFGALAFSAVVAQDYHARTPVLVAVLRQGLRRVPSALAFIIVSSLVIGGLLLAGLLGMGTATLVFPTASVTAGGPGVFLALVVGVAVVVAVVYLTMRWAPAFPAMVEEDIGVRETFRRCWHLSGDNVWRILVITLIAAITTALGSSVLSQLFGLLLVDGLAPALGLDELVAESLALALGSVIMAPLAPVLTAVLYFDLRARRDAPTALQTSAPPDAQR